MIDLKQTETFRKWWVRLRDERARGAIFARLDRLAYGHPGDVEPMGEGISELRIHYGPGYRVYFQKRGSTIIVRRRQRHTEEGHHDGETSGKRMERMTWLRN